MEKVYKTEKEMMKAARKLEVGESILVDPYLPVGYRIAEVNGDFTFETEPSGWMRVTRVG